MIQYARELILECEDEMRMGPPARANAESVRRMLRTVGECEDEGAEWWKGWRPEIESNVPAHAALDPREVDWMQYR